MTELDEAQEAGWREAQAEQGAQAEDECPRCADRDYEREELCKKCLDHLNEFEAHEAHADYLLRGREGGWCDL